MGKIAFDIQKCKLMCSLQLLRNARLDIMYSR